MQTWMWLVIALVLLLIEVVTLGNLVSIWFSAGAFVTYLLSFLKLGFAVDLTVFVVSSLLFFFATKPLTRRWLEKSEVNTNADRWIGVRAILTEPVLTNKWGAVVLDGVRWSVREESNQELESGTEVIIVGLEGAKLVVKKKEDFNHA